MSELMEAGDDRKEAAKRVCHDAKQGKPEGYHTLSPTKIEGWREEIMQGSANQVAIDRYHLELEPEAGARTVQRFWLG